MKKKYIALIVGVAFLIGLALVSSGTFAWFTSEIASSVSNILTGELKINVNGATESFALNLRTDKIFPDQYIKTTGANSIEVKTLNTGTIDIFYTGRFKFDGNNKLSYGLAIEDLKREVYNSGTTKVKEQVYIRDYRVTGNHEQVRRAIDRYDVNGNAVTNGDNIISIKEWNEYANTLASINGGYFVGALKPGSYEKWIYKVKLHKDCKNTPHANKSIAIKYMVNATQFQVGALRSLLKDELIIQVPAQMNQQDFDTITNLWITSEGQNLLNRQ